MDTVYVTIYPGPDTLVNAQVLHVHGDRWDVRLLAPIDALETAPVTFWLDPAPVNCRVRFIAAREDLATGDVRASFVTLDLNAKERKLITNALLGLDDYVRLRNAS